MLCISGCPLAKAQTLKHGNPGQVQQPSQPQSVGGGSIELLAPGPAPNSPTAYENGWVRGSASLRKATGVVDFCVRMATDSREYGPKARIGIALLDSNEKDIADIAVGEIGRGGRQHGKAENDVDKFCGKATVSPDIAGRTTSVNVTVRITGIGTKRVGIDSDDAIDQSGIIVNLP
jgi:hypothetical protein